MTRRVRRRFPARQPQAGIVLVVCLVLLLVMSVAAALAVRVAGSAQAVSDNTRREALAMQAAQAALAYCEARVGRYMAAPATGAAPADAPAGVDYRWMDMARWDGPASAAEVTLVDFAGSASTPRPVRRSPECMAQFYETASRRRVVVTARGFGPEVAAADSRRSRPRGTEVWLQSLLEF